MFGCRFGGFDTQYRVNTTEPSWDSLFTLLPFWYPWNVDSGVVTSNDVFWRLLVPFVKMFLHFNVTLFSVLVKKTEELVRDFGHHLQSENTHVTGSCGVFEALWRTVVRPATYERPKIPLTYVPLPEFFCTSIYVCIWLSHPCTHSHCKDGISGLSHRVQCTATMPFGRFH